MSALLAIAMASAAAEPVALDPLIRFERDSLCAPSEEFGRFLSDMVVIKSEMKLSPGKVKAPAGTAAAFGAISLTGKEGWTLVTLPVEGTWRGITVTELSLDYPPGGDPPDLTISFRADPATLASATRAAGFPASGTEVDDGVYTTRFVIDSDASRPGIVTLQCEIE